LCYPIRCPTSAFIVGAERPGTQKPSGAESIAKPDARIFEPGTPLLRDKPEGTRSPASP
jgi:hypothetical protein